MEKVAEKESYYYREEKGMRISDVIEALLEIEKEEGNLYVRAWSDGLPKTLEFIEIMNSVDGKKKCVVLSI